MSFRFLPVILRGKQTLRTTITVWAPPLSVDRNCEISNISGGSNPIISNQEALQAEHFLQLAAEWGRGQRRLNAQEEFLVRVWPESGQMEWATRQSPHAASRCWEQIRTDSQHEKQGLRPQEHKALNVARALNGLGKDLSAPRHEYSLWELSGDVWPIELRGNSRGASLYAWLARLT